jgi:hypothetical protein
MNRVLEYIEQKRKELAKIPFLDFVRDTSIDPMHRLGFAPCLVPMSMGFADLMMYGLRDLSSKDKHQQILNAHTQVDDHHWQYFLRDLQIMGFDQIMPLTSAIQLVWGEHSAKMRQVIYTLMALVRHASPIMRLATLEAIEASADEGFSLFREVGNEVGKKLNQQLFFFGRPHQDEEDQHEAMAAESIRALISSHPWTPQEEKQAMEITDEVFKGFTAMGAAMLDYAQTARERGPLWPLQALKVPPTK